MELVRQALCTDFSKSDRLFFAFSSNRRTSTALSTILGTSLAVVMSLIGGLTLVYTYVVDLNDQNQAIFNVILPLSSAWTDILPDLFVNIRIRPAAYNHLPAAPPRAAFLLEAAMGDPMRCPA
jgi:hypothetical protein